MKSTGIIRRIDDLGRIVIPKEIRKNFRIKEGDNLEIFVSGEEVILRKYSMMNKINDLASELSEYISECIKRREKMVENHFKELKFVEGDALTCSYVMSTILVNGEATGMILIISEDEKLGDTEMQLAGIVSSFMTKYLEQ